MPSWLRISRRAGTGRRSARNVPLVSSRAALEREFAVSPGNDHELIEVHGVDDTFLIQGPDGPTGYTPQFFSKIGAWMGERGFTGSACVP
jgi:hypothetical protein